MEHAVRVNRGKEPYMSDEELKTPSQVLPSPSNTMKKHTFSVSLDHFKVMAFIHDTFRCHTYPAIGSGSARALSSAETGRSPGSADLSRLVTRRCDQEWALHLRWKRGQGLQVQQREERCERGIAGDAKTGIANS